ncbi:MAG: efflux RND transporter periplasmic adaptor subunit [Verrucomicrobia bacterium]|nr:efflux RND transporter periplasmic adaptor subunit [Verrucomicrobiota bacterium]
MKASSIKRILPVALLAGIAVIATWIILSGDDSSVGVTASGDQVWTCSMHPQVRLPKPGKCPICSMPLILTTSSAPTSKQEDDGGHAPHAMLTLSEHARGMASVETVPVERREITLEIHAVGKVQYNESALAVINSRVEGYIEKLFVDFTGVQVKKDDHLVEIYSPDLVLAQRELLVGLEGPANNALIEASKLKLLRWGLTQQQVDDLIEKRKVSERVTLYSPIDGTVTERMAVQQAMVKSGEMLYKLANLDSVWVYLDIYESELGWVQQGQTVTIQAEAYPGEVFTGRIWFINPVLTEQSRTVKVLVNIANTDQKLKPGMFVSAKIRVPVLADGKAAPTGVGGQFSCPMHPQVLQPEAGACPHCGMTLTVISGDNVVPTEKELLVLAVPVSAVLDSGARKLVYVEHSRGEFMPMEVTLGPRAGGFFPVLAGLEGGEMVAVRGNFLIDSQFQIQGLPSLFYATGQAEEIEPAVPESAEHEHP